MQKSETTNESDNSTPVLKWNQKQQQEARNKIVAAMMDLLERNSLPPFTRARAQSLSSYGISNGTLYKYKDLWHPDYLSHPSILLENAEILVRKVTQATSEQQKLVAQILDAPKPLQDALLSALSASKTRKNLDDLLEVAVKVALEVGREVPLPDDLRQGNAFSKLVSVLTAKEAPFKLAPADPLAAARLKGMGWKLDLLYRDGQPLKSKEVASLLHLTAQEADKRRRNGELLAVSSGRRGYLYPAWQFHEGRVVAGLERVLAELKECDPWTQLAFLVSGDLRLEGDTPLERLKAGDVDRVVWAASGYGNPYPA